MEFWVFSIIFTVAILEIILSIIWNRTYFRIGIPIFRKTYTSVPSSYGKPTPAELEENMKSTWTHSVAFKEFGPDEYAFRDQMFEFKLFGSTPIMRGSSGSIRVIGYANYFPLLMMVAFIIFLFREPIAWFLLFAIFGLLYAMDFWRFNKVGRVASEKWRTWVPPTIPAG